MHAYYLDSNKSLDQEHAPSGAFGVGSSIPISFNLASVCTLRVATRPANAHVRLNIFEASTVD